MDKFPNDPIEAAILLVSVAGIVGGVLALWYLIEHMP